MEDDLQFSGKGKMSSTNFVIERQPQFIFIIDDNLKFQIEDDVIYKWNSNLSNEKRP